MLSGPGAGAAGVPLIGLAHGSRHPDAAASLERLLAAVARVAPVPVQPAYLDLLEPDLPAAAAALAAAGHRRAVAVPLLFTSAFHATVDVPQSAQEAIAGTGLDLRIAPILGTGDDVAALLDRVLTELPADPGAEVLLYTVGSSDEAANDAVRALAARLTALRGAPVRAAFGTRPPRGVELLEARLADPLRTRPLVVVPLFTAPGLLLDPMTAAAREHGVPITGPLEGRLAALVLDRYRQALG